jgi:hypothetical protein
MATPTLKTKAQTIELTYNFVKKTISFQAPKSLRGKDPKKLKLKKGDLLKFSCKQGTLNILFSPPDAFNPSTYTDGGHPVEVTRDLKPGDKPMIECGGTFKNKDGKVDYEKTITINPKTDGYGVTPET